MTASEGSGGEVGMVRSSVGGTDDDGNGRVPWRASAGGAAEYNSSCDGKFPATVTHTIARPATVIALAIRLLEDFC